MRLRPIPVKRALIFNSLTHRRLPSLQGAMWAVCLKEAQEIVGVAIIGRPTARLLDDGDRLQVLRCAVIAGTPNGCSMLYGAASRAARNMGASDLLTYIHDDETGVSLKASGWILDDQFSSTGGEWSRPARPREPSAETDAKVRYWAPWSEYAKRLEAIRASR